MEKLSLDNIEKKESREKGENVRLIIQFMRHGEKGEHNGEITQNGFLKAEKYGADLEIPEGQEVLKIYLSQHCRPEATAMAISEGQKKESELIDEKRLSGYKEDISKMDVASVKENLIWSKDYTAKMIDKINEKGLLKEKSPEAGRNEGELIQLVLDSENEVIDEASLTSKEIGGRIKDFVAMLVESSKEIKSNTTEKMLAVSHSMILEHFLIYILKTKNPEKYQNDKSIIADMGGGLAYLEGFLVEVNRKTEDEVEIEIDFRGEKYCLSLEDLDKIFE